MTDSPGREVRLKVDTGVQANLLPRGVFDALGTKCQPQPARAVLRSYGGDEIMHMGKVCLPVQIGEDTKIVEFFVVKKGRQAILGLHACEQFGLVNRIRAVNKDDLSECIRREYPKLFTGIGLLKREYSMALQDGARPVVEPARRVPHAIRPRLKEELDRLEAAGIIARVREPSDWWEQHFFSSMVPSGNRSAMRQEF
ncbi:uncharacterized protein LOC119403675 [Rhipicephalus sanguineus]|uniref:uncharacterized protein LOC119403675 n=1 Tax=Rhipicephalus sanguineus TaxID=34632 RepID=UPI0018939998|nr:uncharacterized protein LOC119403675 [Rhipicephalus sanguineus]